jgi:hypothetical protein
MFLDIQTIVIIVLGTYLVGFVSAVFLMRPRYSR